MDIIEEYVAGNDKPINLEALPKSTPQIVVPASTGGFHNTNLEASISRLEKAHSYRDLSTIIICPTRLPTHCPHCGKKQFNIAPRVIQSWMGMMRPMNQKVIGPLFAEGLEVGEAYNHLIEMILASPDLSQWKYILTIEEDNMPPPDGLLKLYESMDRFDVVGGLYWTKGECGQPMIYGTPCEVPKNFIPQVPIPGAVQEANGLGMGFNLFKLDIFKKLERPWFKTQQEFTPGKGVACYTQDLYFYEKAAMKGFRFACDNRVLVGHLDIDTDRVW